MPHVPTPSAVTVNVTVESPLPGETLATEPHVGPSVAEKRPVYPLSDIVKVPVVGPPVFKLSCAVLGTTAPKGPTFTVSVTLWPSASWTANVHVPIASDVTFSDVLGPGPAGVPIVAIPAHVELAVVKVPL